MSLFRIALANLQYPATPEESIGLAEHAIAQASVERAGIICFPECFVPGYRGMGKLVPPPDPVFLERAWSAIQSAAAKANLAVVLGTERVVDGALLCERRIADHFRRGPPRRDAARLPALWQAGVAPRGYRPRRGHRPPRRALQICLATAAQSPAIS